jgi:hypothetical protein
VPDRKRWLISVLYETDVLAILRATGAQVTDDRAPVAPPAAGAMAVSPPMPADLRSAFDVLHLQYTAPLCVAVASYKALSKNMHPDRGGEPEEFHRINDAIEIIRHYLVDQDSDIPF